MTSTRIFIALGALNALLAVAAGALGAHMFKNISPAQQAWFHTATLYHMFHALGLLAIAALAAVRPRSALVSGAGVLMLVGIAAFCGSLYYGAITGAPGATSLAPYGGVAFMLAWILVALSSIKA